MKIIFGFLLLFSVSAMSNPYGQGIPPMGMGMPGYGMGGMGIGMGMPGYGFPGMGIPPPPRINPQNYNLPPPQYQTIWDGNCMCYRPFQPNYPF